jgi:hypothetical protein
MVPNTTPDVKPTVRKKTITVPAVSLYSSLTNEGPCIIHTVERYLDQLDNTVTFPYPFVMANADIKPYIQISFTKNFGCKESKNSGKNIMRIITGIPLFVSVAIDM